MRQLLTRVFGSRNERIVRGHRSAVRAANQFEPQLQGLSDEALRAKTDEFRARLKDGATLDQLLPEGFAVVREAARRTLKMRHFDVQLIGGITLHKGVDFAGAPGSPVVAVAAGVVTWAGERTGYGRLIEINHGDGFTTRYAHNERTLVTVGQTVKRGERIALMGSTGRSTGPHVHFEVLRNGRQVNPLSFIGR